MKQASLILIGIIIGAMLAWPIIDMYYLRHSCDRTLMQTVYDTIPYYQPVPTESIVLRYVTARLPLSAATDAHYPDSVVRSPPSLSALAHDSADVLVPIEHKTYTDTAYRISISGYMASLDTVEIYRPIVYTAKLPSRWSIGLTAGAGCTPRGLQPYLGVGITYNLFNF